MAVRDVIVIGASAGGFDAVPAVTARLPSDLPAAVFVTVHVHPRSEGILPTILNRSGPLPAVHAEDGQRIEHGTIYVAPPDYHVILKDGRISLGHGPKENLHRPCINTMFRSAAGAFGARVAGVLLTGLLDDGAAGLWEIQQHGGATIVQEPDEAAFRSMPESAIRGLNVQYILRLAEMAPLLTRLAMADQNQGLAQPMPPPMVEGSRQACPECGGVMTAVRLGKLREFRCHTGHRLGLETMIAQKGSIVEHALEVALSQSEELTDLLESAIAESDSATTAELRRQILVRRQEQEALRRLTDGPEEESRTA
jgi:two-component system chemotaxis response regulator CheB